MTAKLKHSYCASHGTYPAADEPCWACANPFIAQAVEVALRSAQQQLAAERERASELARDAEYWRRAMGTVQITECACCYVVGPCYFDLEAYTCTDYERCQKNTEFAARAALLAARGE